MHLIDSTGKKVLLSAGMKIVYQIDIQHISFTYKEGSKLYIASHNHDDKYFLGLDKLEQFIRLAWLLGDLCNLHVHKIQQSKDVMVLEFVNKPKRRRDDNLP